MFNGSDPMAWLRDPEVRRFVTFLAVGGVNTVVGYGIFAVLILFGLSPSEAVIVGTVLGVLFNFASTGSLVFKSRAGWRLPRFVAVYCVQAALGIAGLHLLAGAGVPTLVAGAVMLPLLAVFTYFAMRRFVYS